MTIQLIVCDSPEFLGVQADQHLAWKRQVVDLAETRGLEWDSKPGTRFWRSLDPGTGGLYLRIPGYGRVETLGECREAMEFVGVDWPSGAECRAALEILADARGISLPDAEPDAEPDEVPS